jgi:hypothetical protein
MKTISIKSKNKLIIFSQQKITINKMLNMLLSYFLKNEILILSHPKIKSNPPKGVINQIYLAGIPKEIAYIEPEKNKIPTKNK